MRRKAIYIGVIAGLGLLLGVGTNISAMNQEYSRIEEEKQSTEDVEIPEIIEMEEKMEKIENLDTVTSNDEEEYKQSAAELGQTELEYEVFDYKEEMELRLSTIEVAIADMEKELTRGVSTEIELDTKNRIQKLTPVVEKYKIILNESTDDTDYKILAEELDTELELVYEQLN